MILLTFTTQVGGVVYLCALGLGKYIHVRTSINTYVSRFFIFIFLYAFVSVLLIPPLALKFYNRVPLPCSEGQNLQPRSLLFCIFNRHYVTKPTHIAMIEVADKVEQRVSGTVTYYLDASFPFFNHFPCLPHLSHKKGTSLDLSFYYRDKATKMPVIPPSLMGYWLYEQPKIGDVQPCQDYKEFSLRWNFNIFQPKHPAYEIDSRRMRILIESLTRSKIKKILLESHLKHRFAPHNTSVRFQGCQAARHDDHLHIEFLR